MKKSSRILAFVLTLLMVVSLMPVSALADELAPASAAESLLLPGMVDIPAIEETEEPVATETPAPTEAPAETEQPEATEAPVLPELDVVLPEVGSAADAVIGEAAETEEEAPVEDVEEAAEDGATTLVDSAIFFSDVHGSTSDLSAVMGGIGSNVDASVAGADGDTCLTVATTTSTVQNALGDTNIELVFSYASSHDNEDGADIGDDWNYSGEAYGEESGENYYVYVIRETDMQNASDAATAAPEFTSWVNGLTDTSKPLFILSHRPLHARRNDNAGAATWYTAISTAAEKMDITFFWAHNHTGETEADTNAYYVAKDGNETFTVYNGSTVTPNFTYMNAGYINANNQDPARLGVATTVGIYADSMKFQDYNSSGKYTNSTYSHNVEVAREFASSGTTTPTLSSISVVRNKLMYSLGEELDITVTAIYSDGTSEKVTDYTTNFDPYTAGVQTVTVSYGGKSTTMKEVIVAAAIVHSDVSIDEYEGTATLSALEAGTAEICREWTCYLSNTQTLSLDWEITDNGDGTYTVTCIGPISEMASEVTYEVNDDTLVLTSVDGTYADADYNKATKTYTINSDGTLTEAGKGVSYLSISERTDAYTIGDELYAKILVTREDGSTEYVTLDDCTVTPSCSCGAETVDDLMNTVALGEGGTYHQVTIGYGGKTVNLLFTVGEAVAHEFDTGVIVSVSDLVSASGTVVKRADTTDLTIPATIKNPVAYDITPGEGYALNPGNYAEITFPIPEGVTNPVVYCVDTAEWFEDIDDNPDTYTVRTSHFSTWTIGENTEITVPENETVEVESITGGTTKKTVYVLTSSISSSNDYLIVNGNFAGSYYALANNSGSVAATGVTVKTDDTIGTYIELDDATDELWTVNGSSSTSLKNGSYYLTYSGSRGNYSLDLSTSSNLWTYSSNRLSIRPNSTTYYVVYESGWDMSRSSDNIYFYVPTEIEENTTVTMKGTYSIEGENVSVAVSENSTAKLTSNLIFTPAADNTAEVESPVDVSTTATYEIVTVDKDGNTVDGDPNDIISKIEKGVVTFTGNYGTALVKVSYDTNGDENDGVVTDYITIEATAPYYTIDLHYANLTKVEDGATFDENATYYIYNDTTNVYEKVEITEFEDGVTYYTTPLVVGEEITSTVALKGIEAGDKYPVWAVVKEHNSENPDGEDLGALGDALHWSVSDTSIATIDSATGVLTFTGENYGTFTVTVSYEGADGKVITDTITISATESLYIVPGDGTNDFPEYPNEGAVRFDKTATAVGNYSETGIAMVELSMTGVNYNKGSEIDVVVMLDMSTSMDDDRIAATVAATKTFIDSIVKNEDGSYNANRVYVGYFNGDTVYTITDSGNIGGELASVDNDTEYNALIAAIEDEYDGALTASGTNYDVSLEKCYNVLTAAKTDGTGNDRQQFVVFMSDGGPTDYATSASNVVSESTIVDWFSVSASDSANWTNSMVAEYWSGLMKTNGVTIYSVGLLLNEQPTSGPQDYRDYSADQNYYVTSTLLTGIASGADYFINCESATDTTEMEGIFDNIAKQILQAATNVVVEDKIGSNYTMNFSIPGYGTAYAVTDALEGTTEFYIQVVEYTLDENNDRSGDPEVLENFTFNADGTLKSHTVDGVVCSGCSHVTITNGVVTAIDGTYFDYKSDSTGEYLTWKTAELTDTELALQYFAYLDNSTGVSADEQIKAGTYYTNEYATLTYTNYNGNQVQQKFPVPQMTWNGAQVSYTFYLVNDAGQPVNRAGRVVPFAEAVYVTEVFTYSIVWNDLEQSAGLDAEYLAQNLVPDVYALYDDDATYNIHVYEDEDKSNLNNHFVIGGDVTDDYNIVTNSWTNASTTYVFNNKSDAEKYHTVGAYIANDGKDGTTTTTYLCKGDGTVSGVQFSEATVTSETDLLNGVYYTLVDGIYTRAITYAADTIYYNLTAASYTAAGGETQWQPGSGDSTTGGTVIGNYIYYVDENGDVYTIVQKTDGTEVREGFDFSNTTVAFAVVWKPELRPDTVVIDYGLPVDIDVIATDSMAAGVVGVRDAAPSGVNEDGTYTRDEDATLTEVDLTHGSARVKNNTVVTYTPNTMTMSAPEVFYYEADVNFYDKDNEFQSTSMYSSVTVVPATTIYYEDSFVTFNNGSGGSTGTWSAETTQSGTQALDRPGPDKYGMMNGMYQDADNVYGYDSTYDDMATYSMGSARYVTVSADNNPNNSGNWPTAEFTFTGTGFDVISMTDNTTGTIFVDVYAGTDITAEAAYNWVVDTYYGYTRVEDGWLKHTWTYYADGWHVSTEEVEAEGDDGVETLPESPEVGQSCVIYEKNYIWTVTEGDNALYQIPVIKSPEMTYGTYTVVITPKFASFFDHTAKAQYDFYLDAIRIYNPTGDLDDDTLDVYTQDEEAYPTFVELRNNLLTAGTFDAIEDEDDEVTGVVFIDGVGNTAEVADYAAYGPNNEVYLASNQAIAFSVSAAGSPEKVMLGVKSLDDAPATITISRVNAAGEKAATKDITVNTATDMYYDISDIVLEEVTGNGESYNIVGDGVIVIQNSGDNLVSLTNIKTTFNAAPVETTGFNLLMSRSYADVATAYIAETTTDAVVDGNTSTGDDVTDDTTGTEGAPGDEESGGDAGDDTGKNIRDTLQNAVSVINRQLEAAAKNIRRAVSGLLARLGR